MAMHPFESLPVSPGQVGIHWFGQSSFAFKDAAGTIWLVDPYFPRERPSGEFIHQDSPLDEAALKTNYVLLTHEHGDHTCLESLLRIRAAFPQARYYGPWESIALLEAHGFPPQVLSTLKAGSTTQVGAATVYAVWAKPPQGAPEEDIPIPDVEHLGYVLEIDGVRVYISGDLFNTMAQHDELLEPIASLKPDIGLLTTHPSEGEFPYFAGSAKMAAKLKLKAAVPAHYDCFVKRTYDPHIWAAGLPAGGPSPIIIPYNEAIVYPINP